MFLPHLQNFAATREIVVLREKSTGVTTRRIGTSEGITSPLWKRQLGLNISPYKYYSPTNEPSEAEDYFGGEEQDEMHFQQDSSTGPAMVNGYVLEEQQEQEQEYKPFVFTSSSLPFGQNVDISEIGQGQEYLTALTLIQHVAYTLSDKIFAFSPETFDLDVALKHWRKFHEKNAFGYTPDIQELETRAGAGAIALGYVFSPDFDLSKRHIPQSIVASSYTLAQMRLVLDQLSLLYSLASPFVAHVAAVDYAASGLVSDYVSALTIADELGLGLVASGSAADVQHMALFATLLAKIMPAVHVFDGIKAGTETTIFGDALDQTELKQVYDSVSKTLEEATTKHSDNEGRLLRLLETFNKTVGTSYAPFEYVGPESPDHVLVVFGTVEASLTPPISKALAKNCAKVGVINVRVYRPFVEEKFLDTLPKSVKTVGVLGQVENDVSVSDVAQHSLLFKDVLATLNFSDREVSVLDIKYSRSELLTAERLLPKFQQLLKADEAVDTVAPELHDSKDRHFTFWDLDESPSVTAPIVLGQLLSQSSSKYVNISSGHDSLVQGGVVRTDIHISDDAVASASGPASITFVGNEKLLKEFDILNGAADDSTLVVKLPSVGVKDEDIEKRLPVGLRQGLATKNINLYVLDPADSQKISEDSSLEPILTQLAFHNLTTSHHGPLPPQLVSAIGEEKTVHAIAAELNEALRYVAVPQDWATVEPEVEKVSLPTEININNFSRFERVDPDPPTKLEDWTKVAKALVFKEAYSTTSSLRPDLGIKTAVVRVKEHRRLTPLTYDRNIFHIEFDLGDSGLTYAIGEALGIHAENDKAEVEEFIQWYGLNAEDIVQVPSREDPDVLESRTVYQALMQNVDIFGRPPKKFYEALSEFAADKKEKETLLALAGPEGATEFKRRAEVDTITFADILLEFTSARPSFHDIVRIVNPMKRREYSIASSQQVTPTSVSLLVVTVNWIDPKGRDRFGQATRYLNALPVGAPVTVSVKPSVMKLPPKSTAPIIMAGLGTGLAPFRAFVQERAYQKQVLGLDIGAVMLYLGSRHQREEYLYGEEWEAYMDAGIITHIGAAFSRDQPHKIYIQNRMRESMKQIRKAYFKEEGAFYLCGPTWPVPDVTAVLQEAVEVEEKSKGAKKVDSKRAIETLKEEGRYVLEVY